MASATTQVLILDTDHFSALTRGTAEGKRLRARLDGVEVQISTTIVSIEEGFRGWTAEAARARSPAARLRTYAALSASSKMATARCAVAAAMAKSAP